MEISRIARATIAELEKRIEELEAEYQASHDARISIEGQLNEARSPLSARNKPPSE